MKKGIATLTALVVLTAGLLSGCATILSGTNQTVTISSTPPGASVRMGPYSGTTPYSVTLRKGRDYPIEVAQDSDKRVLVLQRSFDVVGLINILFWPGFIIDAVTGAMTEYDPDTVHVQFEMQ